MSVKYAIAALLLSLSVGLVCAETTITVNGNTIRSSQSSIIVNNDTVIINGTVVSGRRVQGSGKQASEDRNLNGFDELSLDITAHVSIAAGDKVKCTITADDNILPLILTEQHGRKLRIAAKESYSSGLGVRIAIEVPVLTRAEMNGSGRIDIAGVTDEELALLINGSGNINAKGKVVALQANINGSGNLYAGGLVAQRVIITLNGSGNADIHATDVVTAKLNGSGDISYSGAPSRVNVAVTGSGDINEK